MSTKVALNDEKRRKVPESCSERKQKLLPRKIGMYGNPFFLFLPFWILNGEMPLKFILFEKNMRRFQPFIKKETREIT
ncbi:hypothetical protein [Fusobacterium necrophorum]|nr:hypothetical protein [Fusobacterium necrophorum]MDK4493350.1 hypothetical protein [Fusobacterium necrophorum]